MKATRTTPLWLRFRADPGSYGLVSANGGYLSKQSVGIYSTSPPQKPWRAMKDRDVTGDIRAGAIPVALSPAGAGIIETFTVGFEKGRAPSGVIIGRLADQQRFIAAVGPDDQAILHGLLEGEPIGRKVNVHANEKTNVFTFAT